MKGKIGPTGNAYDIIKEAKKVKEKVKKLTDEQKIQGYAPGIFGKGINSKDSKKR